MVPRPLLRVLGVPAEEDAGISRFEESVLELRRDTEAALQKFLAKNEWIVAILKRPDDVGSWLESFRRAFLPAGHAEPQLLEESNVASAR